MSVSILFSARSSLGGGQRRKGRESIYDFSGTPEAIFQKHCLAATPSIIRAFCPVHQLKYPTNEANSKTKSTSSRKVFGRKIISTSYAHFECSALLLPLDNERKETSCLCSQSHVFPLRFLFPNLLFVQERPINAYPSAVHVIMTESKWSSLLYPLARLFIWSTLCSLAPPLVADTDEVVGELLHGVGCDAGLDGFRVMGDEDGLGGLDDDDALSALE